MDQATQEPLKLTFEEARERCRERGVDLGYVLHGEKRDTFSTNWPLLASAALAQHIEERDAGAELIELLAEVERVFTAGNDDEAAILERIGAALTRSDRSQR